VTRSRCRGLRRRKKKHGTGRPNQTSITVRLSVFSRFTCGCAIDVIIVGRGSERLYWLEIQTETTADRNVLGDKTACSG